jgi:osmoprotectant transport system permease protein
MSFLRDLYETYVSRADFFLDLFLQHAFLAFTAAGIILVIALTLGVLMTRNRRFADIVLGVTGFLYTIPSIAMFGFFIAFTGIGNPTAIAVMSIYGVLPMIRNTYVGLMEVDPDIIEAATGMGSTRWQLLVKIKFPLALPVITAGFRTTVVMAIALGAIASFIGAGGLGVAIWRGISTYNQTLTVAGSLLVALFAVITDFLLSRLERWIQHTYYGRRTT